MHSVLTTPFSLLLRVNVYTYIIINRYLYIYYGHIISKYDWNFFFFFGKEVI